MTRWKIGVVALAVSLWAAGVRADDTKLKVKEGDAFPDVAVAATHIDVIKKGAKEASIKDFSISVDELDKEFERLEIEDKLSKETRLVLEQSENL